jgi:hypothetical protein
MKGVLYIKLTLQIAVPWKCFGFKEKWYDCVIVFAQKHILGYVVPNINFNSPKIRVYLEI